MLGKEASKAPLAPPSPDKRWRLIDATMRKHGYKPSTLIETLHTAQQSFGYLDEYALRYVAKSLTVPLSKVYGVATFYNLFRLKPQGEHTCVVCLGTACYIKGAAKILSAVEQTTHVQMGQTTADNKISLLTARCLGACGIAPAAVLDEQVIGNLTPQMIQDKLKQWTE
ncbi:MAG: bidirectional hydrogenase complex protein HoxE [Candidatus Obscuribacterales bacterium]|nr:bidirectional hydrogenase complex protein HoxE [Candidatus Obscuribacterales bacterium]